MQQIQPFPETGFVRLPQVLSVFPVSKSTWWAGVKSGKFPEPFKLGTNCTAWKAEDILSLIEQISSQSKS
jgi:prophage regulatory protein